jgi:F-type H+-transporting ATPase subunit b
MKKLTVILALMASPAYAKPFFSLQNTDFIVSIAFILFVSLLLYLKVPGLLTGLLDKRAEGISKDLNDARKLREEAQTLLASFERKQKEVAEHAEGIVAHAKAEAEVSAVRAEEDLKASIARRLQAAEDQIASAEAAAVKEVRDTAITVAVAAATDVIEKSMTAKDAGVLIDDAIAEVGSKLH